jgi:D-3-phosphoglycerate dehydrogenase / 2-oxoglutarate reductase
LNVATLGLVGLGHIGRGVAKRLSGWDVNILASDPNVTTPPDHVELTDLDTLLSKSDIASMHAAPTVDNRSMMGAERLARMKPGSLLINTARALKRPPQCISASGSMSA